jgi:uncharacterized membrane protein
MAVQLTNPLTVNTIAEFVQKLLEVVVNIGVIVLGIMLVYVGYLFVVAQGNEEKLREAKRAFVWTVIGGAILLGAWGISMAIKEAVDSITGP